ncbi:hypothetical protein IX84_12430 [Phaeodactylibacter xiamenensis]|uniref:Uncharacterized protein n=2 Tax=Phaeodactylibacter xiamenensis TaxID=1524460 RepID=A0A098S756_9BACT|nr:hypothetical protein IX84_12430 [Phaeodactylibacter xiamenensis]
MEKDDPQPSRGNNGNGGGKGNFLIRLLPLIIMFLVRRPKLIIPALLVVCQVLIYGLSGREF